MEHFTVYSNEIERRIDPHFYRPEFVELIETFEKSKFQLKTFKEISEKITSGATPKAGGSDYTTKEEGIAFIRSGDINEDKTINFGDVLYIKQNIHNKLLKSSQLKKGDILIAIVGATIGQVSIYDYGKEANINQAIALVRLKQGISPEYVKAFLLSNLGQKELDRIKRPVARANINLDEIGDFKILLPPLEIQKHIVEIMQSAYSEKKQKEQDAEKLLNSINDYILDELGIKIPKLKDEMYFTVNSKEVENNRSDSYYFQPKFREIARALKNGKYEIKELKEFITKIHYGVSIKNVYVSEGIPLLRIMNLKPNKVDLTNVIKLPEIKRKEIGSGFVYEGNLLISRSGSVGIVAVVPKEADGFAFGSFMIKFCVNTEINKEYVSIWLNSQISQLLIKREKIGAIQGNITISTIENLKIPFPPLEIQNKIAKEVIKKMKMADKLNKEVEKILTEAKEKVENIVLGEK